MELTKFPGTFDITDNSQYGDTKDIMLDIVCHKRKHESTHLVAKMQDPIVPILRYHKEYCVLNVAPFLVLIGEWTCHS